MATQPPSSPPGGEPTSTRAVCALAAREDAEPTELPLCDSTDPDSPRSDAR